LAGFCTTTPDADSRSVVDELEGAEQSPESHLEAQTVWGSVRGGLSGQVSGLDPTPIDEWMPKGVDLSWTGRNLNTVTISRHFLEAQLNNLLQAKADLIAHYRRSLRISLDTERALQAVRRFRDIEQDRSYLIDIINGQGPSGMAETGAHF
jgi:hypothetical protein